MRVMQSRIQRVDTFVTRIAGFGGKLLGVLVILGMVLPTSVLAAGASPTLPAAEWVEPKGINIVDLVGQVPEETLKDAILVVSGTGIVRYVSGSRVNDTVTITVKINPRYTEYNTGSEILKFANFDCLGQPANFDQWPSIMPAGKMRVFDSGVDITDQVIRFQYFPAGFHQPSRSPNNNERYDKVMVDPPTRDGNGSLTIPANMGCEITAPGYLRNMTATLTFEQPSVIQVQTLGSQTFTYRTYIGIGAAGTLESLRNQMMGRFGGRHDKFDLDPPAGTDFVIVNYPPASADAGAWGNLDLNLRNPTGGTYRLGNANIGAPGLSVDHFNSMGLSLYGQWHDTGATPSDPYLRFFDNAYFLSAPEVFIPDSIPYDPCMTNGGCPDALLQLIYNATMQMTITYLKVEQSACTAETYTYRPLRMAGPIWAPGSQTQTAADSPYRFSAWESPFFPADDVLDKFVYLPMIARAPDICTPVTPPPLADCPCGVFTADGRMVDFIR